MKEHIKDISLTNTQTIYKMKKGERKYRLMGRENT